MELVSLAVKRGSANRTGTPGRIVRLAPRLVLPAPVLRLVKLMVSAYEPTGVLFALALRLAMTVVLAPEASVPLADERVSQLAFLPAVQLSVELPTLETVNV